MAMSFWLVASALPNQMGRAEVNLTRQGFVCYIPRAVIVEKKKERITPLFSRYFFVRIEEQWRSILSTFGVASVIMSADQTPATISNKIIASIRSRENSRGLVELDEPRFRDGQRVQIIAGPFAGLFGLYRGMPNQDRERVLLSLMGGVVGISVSCRAQDVLVAA